MKHIFTIFFLISFATYSDAQYSFHESIGFTPTAFNLQKGEKRFTNTDLVINAYTEGLSNNVSFNAGLLGIKKGAIIRFKYTQKLNENVRFALSPNLIFDDDNYRGYFHPGLTGILTIGKPDLFINFSYTRAYDLENVTNNIESKKVKITEGYDQYSFGASAKISKAVSLVSEHLFIVNEYSSSSEIDMAHSLMARMTFKKQHQIQVGVYLFLEIYRAKTKKLVDSASPLPAISYSYYWGI